MRSRCVGSGRWLLNRWRVALCAHRRQVMKLLELVCLRPCRRRHPEDHSRSAAVAGTAQGLLCAEWHTNFLLSHRDILRGLGLGRVPIGPNSPRRDGVACSRYHACGQARRRGHRLWRRPACRWYVTGSAYEGEYLDVGKAGDAGGERGVPPGARDLLREPAGRSVPDAGQSDPGVDGRSS